MRARNAASFETFPRRGGSCHRSVATDRFEATFCSPPEQLPFFAVKALVRFSSGEREQGAGRVLHERDCLRRVVPQLLFLCKCAASVATYPWLVQSLRKLLPCGVYILYALV